ncbi:MAG: serine acetyltransferase [Acetatifactor sp.]|nr:serine acetyltransferase [Acetatifactor sp.]
MGHTTADQKMQEIVGNILSDYKNEDRYINKMNLFEQPDTEIVRDILNKLIKIVFPGFFREKYYRFYNLGSQLNVLIEDVVYNLQKQIFIALNQSPQYKEKGEDEVEADAREIILEFLRRIPKVREYVETDVEATFDGDPAAYNRDEIVLSYPGLLAITVSRIAHELYDLGVPLIPRIMTEYAHSRTGIDIHPGTTIGKYFFIDHGTGIVIGETAIIGEHVKIYQGVTIGALSTRGGQRLRNVKRHPTIEDNVTIYSGASILGGETVIGKNAVIGSNAFITASIPADARVSIKNQELNIKGGKPGERAVTEVETGDSWCYVI